MIHILSLSNSHINVVSIQKNQGDKSLRVVVALKGHQTLFIIDDCCAEGEINKKRDALSELAFSGRHRNHSLWVLTQKYDSVSKDEREQIKWLCLFFTKDMDSFEDCLRKNDVIPDKNERDRLKKCLQDRPYSKLIPKCYQPTGY